MKRQGLPLTSRLIILTELLPRNFIDDHLEEVLEVTACHAINIVEVDNNCASSEEVNNSNETKKMTFVFDRIKPSNTRSLVFQRLIMVTKEEGNQSPTSTSTLTSDLKRLSISALKKNRPSTSAYDRLKMINDQHERNLKTLKAKSFHEENNNNKIQSCVPSHMKRMLSIDINTEGSLTMKTRLMIFTNPTNEEGEQILDENMRCRTYRLNDSCTDECE